MVARPVPHVSKGHEFPLHPKLKKGQDGTSHPEVEIANVNGQERIRARFNITYEGFGRGWLRWPLQPNAPAIDYAMSPVRPTRSMEPRSQRNHASRDRAARRNGPY